MQHHRFRKQKSSFSRYQLSPRILDTLPKIGYHQPTPVQHKVIPLLLQRRNLLVEAATGTGKTAAYALPLLTHIDTSKRSAQLLVLVPSRELARQVEDAIRSFTSDPKLRVEAFYGGSTLESAEVRLKTNPHVVIAVPGRLKDIIRSGKFDFVWRDIKYLVVDEADKLLELGFQDAVDGLVSNLRNTVQVALFSATISQDVEALVRERFTPVWTIRLSPQEALRNINFHSVQVRKGDAVNTLAALIREYAIPQALIFCNKRDEVENVYNYLRSCGYETECYHGLLHQIEREGVMRRFKLGQVRFLVATDLAARGLDVENLPAVINYSFPKELEIYLHRCGRTGRAGNQGFCFNLILSKEDGIHQQTFHDETGIQVKEVTVNTTSYVAEEETEIRETRLRLHFSRGKKDKISPSDVVGFLVKQCELKPTEIGTVAVYDTYTLVDVPQRAWSELKSVEGAKLKGKSVKVTRYTAADRKRAETAVKKRQLGVRDKAKLKKAADRRKKK